MIPAFFYSYVEGLKTHDVEMIASTVADELCFVTAITTLNKQRFLAMLRALYAGFPDWHYDHDVPEVREAVIAVRWRQSGTHLGTLELPGIMSIVATGIRVVIPEQYFYYKVDDLRITEIRPESIPGGAPGGIMQQLGVPMPPL